MINNKLRRIKVLINGIVQGVGFRPYIHRHVKKYGLSGWIKNTSYGVEMEIEGAQGGIDSFLNTLEKEAPKLALIERVKVKELDSVKGEKDFRIIKSTTEGQKFTLISPDIGICEDCLKELFDKHDRRYRFPFINCTNCGPRFTIIEDVPYDRDKTTMKSFNMCDACNKEYRDISDRRYHAQPDCCPDCGPSLMFMLSGGESIKGDPIDNTISYLKEGRIVAIKGIGGIHLACDGLNKEAVKRLRERKHRDEKPLALMCRDVEEARRLCTISEDEKKYLESPRRPIVLLRKRDRKSGTGYISENGYIGIMLPYTPVHYLIMEKMPVLVMTSGNISDIPIISDNKEGIAELSDIADAFLLNNRDIKTKCDDSLLIVHNSKEYFIRRSRGYVPYPLKMHKELPEIIACGAEQKASFALTKGRYIFPSQHIGDLKNIESYVNYEKQIENFKRLFDISPKAVACDLHPDYLSSEYAREISKKLNIPLFKVQHHHAHMGACMADNNLSGDVIGIVWDGTGLGTDGTIWGGEFFAGGYNTAKRYASIRPILLPGGDKAIKEIYRIGYSVLFDALGEIPEDFKKPPDNRGIEAMIKNTINCPKATSIGRLFDGVSALLDIKRTVSYEGQGAMLLEAMSKPCRGGYTTDICEDSGLITFDYRKMIREIVRDIQGGIDKGIISAKFMNTLIEAAVSVTIRIRSLTGLGRVVLSGGVFQNMYILSGLEKALKVQEFDVYIHQRVSTNDEGICLGQAMIAGNGGENVFSSAT